MKTIMIAFAKHIAVVGMMSVCAACSSDTSGSAYHADSAGTSGTWSGGSIGIGSANGYYYDGEIN